MVGASFVTLERTIRQRIAAIPEPCAIAMGRKLTVGEMGLIEEVTVVDGVAVITLCLTDPGCVHFAAMQAFITDVLADLPLTGVTVSQSLDTLWTPDRMLKA